MGKLYVVATPIGNIKDISENAVNILKSVSLIACEDTRTSKVLLDKLGIQTRLVSYHKFNERSKSDSLIDYLKTNDLALISDAGCPCISDPGSILVNECINNGIEVFAMPGASAVTTSLMVSGFQIKSFTFYGFLDRKDKKIVDELNIIKNDSSEIAVIYESPMRIKNMLTKIMEVLDNPYVCVCNDLTKKFERKYYGLSSEVLLELDENANASLGEYVIVVRKNHQEDVDDEKPSIESLIIDMMIKEKITMKDAIKRVSEKYQVPKNTVYDASLNLKKMDK